MPKKITTPNPNDYVTKEYFHAELQIFGARLKEEILSEVRVILNEFSNTIKDHLTLLYNEDNGIKLIQTEHTRQIDTNTKDIEDLQKDVGLLETLSTA